MSRENVDLVLAGFETYNAHGMRATARNYHPPDVEYEMSPSWAIVLGNKALWRGRDQVRV
jgi:hypothetical protein